MRQCRSVLFASFGPGRGRALDAYSCDDVPVYPTRRLAFVILLTLTACQHKETDTGSERTERSGCETPSVSPGAYVHGVLTVNGLRRTYHLAVPLGDPHAPRALVLVFHGRGGNGREMRDGIGKALEFAAQGKALFVYPDGVDNGWPNHEGKDVAFVDALLHELPRQVCFDPRRIFATGFSYGAIMSNTLGCARGGVIRGIAPMSGAGPRIACNGTPVAAWISHGADDRILPEVAGEGSRDHWVRANGCRSESHPTSPPPCVAYEGCGANPVVWCEFPGGHEMPAFVPAAVWKFFEDLT